jgi:DNA-binding MarR family transcriptional regulator
MPSEHVGILIAAARRRIKQAALSRAARHGLSAQQFWFLVAVVERPGSSHSEISERARTDAPTASRVLAALEQRRLVRTAADPADRRRTCVFPTPAGERLAPELIASAREIRAGLTAGMSPSEIEGLREGLRRVIDNLERLDQAGAAPVAGPDKRRSA